MPEAPSKQKTCLRDKCCCFQGCCAGSCCTIGIVLLITGPVIFGGIRAELFENVVDLMFIDNTAETEATGPLADMVAEKTQFEEWKKPMKEAFEKCAKENSAADCIDGLDVAIAVFNVTNPEDIVNGGKPTLQELGPIFMKKYVDKTNIDTDTWDKDGVAKYQQVAIFELDEAKCKNACKDLLKAKVVVPNPAYNTFIATGAEMLLGAIMAVGATAQMLPAGADIGAAFGITDATQSAAFMQVFLLEQDQNKKMAGIGGFLMTAQAAAEGLQQTPPDTSGTCFLGTSELSALTCGTVLQKLMEAIPTAWAGTMEAVAPLYGTGAAAPVFIEVTVAQALGFEANFTDPLSQMSDLSFAAATSYGPPASDPPGVFREVQMAKKFQHKGIGYNVRFGGLAHDCRMDPDCTLSTLMPDSCTVSDACMPTEMKGFLGITLPGRLWGEAGGFDLLKPGSEFRLFKDGLVMQTITSDEKSLEIKTGDHAGSELKHFEQSLLGLNERNENCDGDGPGSPGFDCNGPKHTLNLGPLSGGVPLYMSQPFFDTTQLFANDPSKKSFKYGPTSYNPADKVVMSQCTGNAWCAERNYATYVKHESATGFAFFLQGCAQMNLRIGSVQSMFFPKMADATVPVLWMTEKIMAPDKLLGNLYTLQSVPSMLAGLTTMFMTAGGVCMVLGLLCCGLILYRHKEPERKEVQIVARDK